MYRNSSIPPIIWIVILFLMMLDARILGAVICIPVGALMLSQCHKAKDAEHTEKYDPVGVVGGIGMLFFGLCIIINYFFIK